MSYSVPASYVASASPQLGVPSMLNSDPLLQFKGARSVIKSVPASTGSAIGPGTAVQFQIPMSTNGYIRPNSMYLRFKVTVSLAEGATSYWSFGGNVNNNPGKQTVQGSTGGAGSVIDRATVMFPGGVTMTYNYYNHFRNAVIPHCLSPDYIQNDLRQLESAGVNREVTTTSAISRTIFVCHPLDLPVFNSPSAVPLLLLSGGITLEFLTASVAQAFYTNTADGVSSYALSELSLVYEELVVSPEFKSALLGSVAERPYSIGISDRTPLGVFDGGSSVRVNIGVGLSSVKAILGTMQPPIANSTVFKNYESSGMLRWNLFLNGQQITLPNLDTDSVVFAEMQRALSTLFDHKLISNTVPSGTSNNTTVRNFFVSQQFLFGCSTAVYNDAAFALSGVPADQIAVEVERGAQTADKWQYANEPTAGAAMYLWAMHDTVLTILPDGTVSIRK